MSFESFRCMDSSEDTIDEGPANCQYPKCWIGTCPHKQARDCLSEAEKGMVNYHCESFMNFPDEVRCGTGKRPCKSYFLCEGMKKALRGVK